MIDIFSGIDTEEGGGGGEDIFFFAIEGMQL